MSEREAERKAERDALLAAQLPTGSPSPSDDPEHWDKMASEGFRRIVSSLHPNGNKFMISVFDASEGTPNNSIAQEGERSGLTARGYGLPVLVFEEMSVRKIKHNGEE